ncbi:hypothetical protein PCASD_22488 [Puccinia coronata f. sp. avenae]|uniref:Endonuclease/exonuclease/phosphatase domain-containing protein n=1 Tax=Puccinia coronata f. sp. avenae TaxID=200324 RepID=A0A2N5TRG5_9BASI|nr:hypothetical protein PCASD_22488 [Puccinia coronata f. sp. avenae]
MGVKTLGRTSASNDLGGQGSEEYHASGTNTLTSVTYTIGTNKNISSAHPPCPQYNKHTGEIEGATRFILTNVGLLSTVQLHSALQHTLRHQKHQALGIVQVKPVLQPNRRRRFDLWVKHENAAGLRKALRLDFKSRKSLILERKKSTSWEEHISKHMLPRYRLYMWQAYRDRPIKPTSNTRIAGDRLNVLTWNINGIKSKLPALQLLLQEQSVGIAAIQEHLRTINNYIPGIRI